MAQILLRIQKGSEIEVSENMLKLLRNDCGSSSVEYALLVAIIAAVIVGAVTLLGGNLKSTFDRVATIVLKP